MTKTTFLLMTGIGFFLAQTCGCSTTASQNLSGGSKSQTVFQPEKQLDVFLQDPILTQKVLRLNPESLSETDVDEILSHCPAPRIINLNGSAPLLAPMDSFSKFLIGRGYPEERVRSPLDGSYSYSSFISSRILIERMTESYKKEGMRPMLNGHSQGGMLVIKTLHELEEDLKKNPAALKVRFASAIATGKLMRVFWGQWDMLTRLRKIPDSVDEFAGYHIQNDPLSGGLVLGSLEHYQALNHAKVYNIALPAGTNHLHAPSNALFTADIWPRIKKHWCLELQALIVEKAAAAP